MLEVIDHKVINKYHNSLLIYYFDIKKTRKLVGKKYF